MAQTKYTSVFDKILNLPATIGKITNISADYSDLIDKNRLGVREKDRDVLDLSDDMGIMDILRGMAAKEKGNIPYFSKDYAGRVNQLQIFPA